jgi:antitoxin HigA-1
MEIISRLQRKAKPIHPGEVLADILEDLDMSSEQIAQVLDVSLETVDAILQGQQPITVDLAIRVGKAMGNGPQLWLNLQQKIDIWEALKRNEAAYDRIPSVA